MSAFNKITQAVGTVTLVACAAVGVVALYDKYFGHQYLTTNTGRIVGRVFKNGKFYLYVRRFKDVYAVEVDKERCYLAAKGDYFNLDSAIAKKCRLIKVMPEDVMDIIDEDFVEKVLPLV